MDATTRPSLADLVGAAAAAAALLPLTILEVLRATNGSGDAGWVVVVIALFAALHVAAALRRRSPLGGLVIGSAIMLALTAVSLPGSPTMAVLLPSSLTYLVFIFTAAASGARLADAAAIGFGLTGAAIVTVVAIASGDGAEIAPGPGALTALAGFLVASIGAAWALGRYRLEFRRTRAARELAIEQAAELRRQAERERAAEERRGLGRELHDVVSHSLAVMVAQAEASRVLLGRDDARARTAIEHVVATGRDAMADMRGLVGVLAESGGTGGGEAGGHSVAGPGGGAGASAPRRPSPGLEELPDLVARTSGPGRIVALEHAGAVRPVSPGVALTAYRIVQESLTNTLKHTAPPTTSTVRLDWGDDVLELTIDDDGGGTDSRTVDGTVGRGIRGMRERVLQLGGHLESGPIAGSGSWRTRAMLPFGAESPR